MKIICAFDSFKGCLSPESVCLAAMQGIKAADSNTLVRAIPLSDGGDGLIDTLKTAGIGHVVSATCLSPATKPISAEYILDLPAGEAYIESAQAIGLSLLGDTKMPISSTDFGLGQLIADAISRGANKIFIGLGGSATTCSAIGTIQALGAKIYGPDHRQYIRPVCGADLQYISQIDTEECLKNIDKIDIFCLCDVNNPHSGPHGAAAVYAPQKGATPEQIKLLDNGLKNVENIAKKSGFIDVFSTPGSGAAGGIGGGLMGFANTKLLPGAQTIFKKINLEHFIERADIVLTGEGASDSQTVMHGKLPAAVLRLAQKHHKPCFLFSGRIQDTGLLKNLGFIDVFCINHNPDNPAADPLQPAVATERIKKTVERWYSTYRNNKVF